MKALFNKLLGRDNILGGLITPPKRYEDRIRLTTIPDLNDMIWDSPEALLQAVLRSREVGAQTGCVVLSGIQFKGQRQWDVLDRKQDDTIELHNDGNGLDGGKGRSAITFIYSPRSLKRWFCWGGTETCKRYDPHLHGGGIGTLYKARSIRDYLYQIQYNQGTVIIVFNARGYHDGYGAAGPIWRRIYDLRDGKYVLNTE